MSKFCRDCIYAVPRMDFISGTLVFDCSRIDVAKISVDESDAACEKFTEKTVSELSATCGECKHFRPASSVSFVGNCNSANCSVAACSKLTPACSEFSKKTAPVSSPYTRPSKDEYYGRIARVVSERSTCLRRRYGAVIVKDDRILATGYNGSARGQVNCCDAGTCRRIELGVKHGERYELCMSIHAEMNAIIQAGYDACKGATLYLAGFESDGTPIAKPECCEMCKRVIKNSGLARVVPVTYDNEA